MKKKTKKLFLFNSLTRKKELFSPILSSRVKIYSCGPTVYGHTHLGHMRTYTNTDVLLRVLKYCGYQPYQIMNITDVGHLTGDRDSGEDKLEKAAREEKLDAWQLSKKYAKEFFEAMARLNISKPKATPRATENIEEMILLIKKLEDKGFAYRTADGIYFDTSKVSGYGRLANVSLADLEEGARVEKNLQKRNPTDFALWKFSPKGSNRQMEWSSPWSKKGFPGWHLECSVMAMKYLSNCFSGKKFLPKRFKTIDIHSGGIEHINVHHTNEIAQTEASTGKKFANYWVHYNWLQVEGRKMSKSLNNFFYQKDLIKRGYEDFMPLRYLFLGTHYRKKMNFTWTALKQAKENYWGIIDLLEKNETEGDQEEKQDQENKVKNYLNDFEEAITTDLNLPQALAVFHQVLKNKSLTNKARWKLLNCFDQVFGLRLKEQVALIKKGKRNISTEIKKLVEDREQSRREKNWPKADEFRIRLEKMGYLIEDTPSGPKVISKK